ncbi:MAG: hypothetical protein AAGA96_12470 [Verrucomicrobiota bacterium]
MTTQAIDQVELGPSLGHGICGEVFEVSGSDPAAVLKKFNSMSVDRHFLARNWEKQKAMPSHPGVVEIYEAQFNTTPYQVIQKRIRSFTFADFDGIKEARAWKLIRGLADAMGHAHKFGLYHGHLHPGNVHVEKWREGERPVVTDFGTGLVGEFYHLDPGESVYFSAPEQLMPNGTDWTEGAIQRWDVYSFGLIAFWLINERLPRGLGYLKQRHKDLAASGGRPLPVDQGAFLANLYEDQKVSWGRSLGLPKEFKLFREIIDRCLSLNPNERPIDMREVRNLFRSLDHQFALENAEDRVVKEKLKQKAKLISARMLALTLGVSFLAATFYLIDYLKQSTFFKHKVSELDQVVVSQQAHIEHLDDRWAETVKDLKSSREAADAFFHKMAGGNSAGGSGVATLKKEDLEKSRKYYVQTLTDIDQGDGTELERARAMHSLAHIEKRLGLGERALSHFEEAISGFTLLSKKESLDRDSAFDLHMRLADSHENLVTLLEDPISGLALSALELAVRHFELCIEHKPENSEMVTRLAGTSFLLGQAYDAHQRYDEAIRAYSNSAEYANSLRESGSEDREALTELIGKLQYQVAHSLRLAERIDESIDAHIAGMETMEELRHVNGFTPIQSIQMASSFLELGELFDMKEATNEDLDQLYNESLRLLSPLNQDNPSDVEIEMLLCRSLSHLGQLERSEGQWSAGYRLSVRGIEALKAAVDSKPDHADGRLVLAESRMEHLKFFDHENDTALKIALLGIETAEEAYDLLDGNGVGEPRLSQMRQRLGLIFKNYGEIFEELGEGDVSRKCFERASVQLSFNEPTRMNLVQ